MLLDLATSLETIRPVESSSEDSLIQLLNFLRKHAILHQTDQQREQLKKSLRDGTANRSSSLAKEIIRLVPWRHSNSAPEDALKLEELSGTGVPLVIVDKVLATRLSISELVPKTSVHPEVIRAGFLFESETCERIQNLPSSVGRTVARDEVWITRFEPLVRVSDSTKIYDRYVLEEVGGRIEWRPGMVWFLNQLRRGGMVDVNIEVVTMPPTEVLPTTARIQELLDRTLQELGEAISQITLTVCKGSASLRGGPKLSEPFHDRVVQFVCNGHGRAISLGGGLDMFSNPNCRSGSIAYHPVIEKEPIGESLSEINRIIAGANPNQRVRVTGRSKRSK